MCFISGSDSYVDFTTISKLRVGRVNGSKASFYLYSEIVRIVESDKRFITPVNIIY